MGLNNLKVVDLTMLRSSRMSLSVAGMNLLLEGLSEPSIKYENSIAGLWLRTLSLNVASNSSESEVLWLISCSTWFKHGNIAVKAVNHGDGPLWNSDFGKAEVVYEIWEFVSSGWKFGTVLVDLRRF